MRPAARRLTGVVGANVLGQGLTVVALIVCTHLYAPAEFATFQIVFSVVLVATPVLSGAVEVTLGSAEDYDDALGRARRVVIRTGAAAALGCAAALVLRVAGYDHWAAVVMWSTAATAVSSLGAVDTGWLVRRSDVRALGLRALCSAVTLVLTQILLAELVGPSLGAILGGFLLSRTVPLAIGRGNVPPYFARGSTHRPRPGAWAWPTAVIVSNAALQIPVLALAGSNPADLAAFALALRIAGLPASLLGTGIAQATALVIARERGGRTAHDQLATLQRQVWSLSLGCGLALAVGALTLGRHVVGNDYAAAMPLLAILALPLCGQLAARVAMPLFAAYGRTGRLLGVQVARLGALVVCGLAFAHLQLGMYAYAAVVAVVTGCAVWAATVIAPAPHTQVEVGVG